MNNFGFGNFREPPPDAPGLFAPVPEERKPEKDEEFKKEKNLFPKVSMSLRKIRIKPETLGE